METFRIVAGRGGSSPATDNDAQDVPKPAELKHPVLVAMPRPRGRSQAPIDLAGWQALFYAEYCT